MSDAIFSIASQSDLVEDAIARCETISRFQVRPVCFETDLMLCATTLVSDGSETIFPQYGMEPETEHNTVTLVCEADDRIIGQISANIELHIEDGVDLELWVEGVFVSAPYRGMGAASHLAKAVLHFCEGWRRLICEQEGLPVSGEIFIDADTLPGSASEGLLRKMRSTAEAGLSFEGPCEILNLELE